MDRDTCCKSYQDLMGYDPKTAKGDREAVLLETPSNEWPSDFDGSKLNLRPYLYQMGKLPPIRMMVKRGDKGDPFYPSTYRLLRSVKHPNLLPVENFYPRGYGWVVVPCVDGTLMGWLKSDQGASMFQGDGVEKGMSPQFRTMLIDLCSLVAKLSQAKLFPSKFGIEDMYIKLVNGVPRILALLSRVESKKFSPFSVDIREHMQAIIEQCCQVHHVQLNPSSKAFTNIICQGPPTYMVVPLPTWLTSYPDIWTTRDKESYLMNIVSGGHLPWQHVRSRINNTQLIDWPRTSDESVIPDLQQIVSLGGRWEKSTGFPFNYIHECRNCFKHFFDLPVEIQEAIGGSPQGLILKMEEWDPNIWTKLYELYGPLVHK